jgi:SAM-dependent methyltransferase
VFDLFLISFILLLIELAAIRWLPAYVTTLTFFTNFVLLAAFVGMSVGCLATQRRFTVLDYLPSLIAVTCAAALAVYVGMGYMWLATVEVGNPSNPELVYFGTERAGAAAAKPAVPIELLLSGFFVLTALWFVALGQVLGRKLAAIPSRILAYTVNIAGSLAGIVVFGAMSYYEMPPVCWFVVGLAGVVWFLRETRQASVPNLTLMAGTLAMIGIAGWRTPGHRFYWSPYYSIRYSTRDRDITVNGMTHQRMVSRREFATAYALPYLLRRDCGLPPIRDVLVIGAGSGNDVSHALGQGADRVSAVEIDPAIARLGKLHHPDRPYDDPRVQLTIDDGRAFLRNADRQYDLIVYALVDSLTLHSSFSSIRLENFLFTREAVADVRRRLKPGGLFVAYNFYRQGWIVARLRGMMLDEFGTEPLVLSFPPRAEIHDTENEGEHLAVLMCGAADAIAPLRERFARHETYEFHATDVSWHETNNGFGVPSTAGAPAAASLNPGGAPGETMPVAARPNGGSPPTPSSAAPPVQLNVSRLVQTLQLRQPTDDWPFLYLREPRIPAHNWRGLGLLLFLSCLLLVTFAPPAVFRGSSPTAAETAAASLANDTLGWRPGNLTFFMLGAGFMLLETKSVTQAAQLFGSTWLVNSIVFAAVLVMILGANLYVLLASPRRLLPYYVGLAVTLLVGLTVPLDWFLNDPFWPRLWKCGTVLCGPILFAGVIFASAFRRTANPDRAFGFNIAGVVLGGLAEYASLVIGYRWLLVLAAGMYAVSLLPVLRRPSRPAMSAPEA